MIEQLYYTIGAILGVLGIWQFVKTKKGQKITQYKTTEDAQNNVAILFVDDRKFKIAEILKRQGWKNVELIKDIDNLNSKQIQTTDIFFIDVQGVGKALQYKDEGLGLAKDLKTKYPNKRIIIYSAESEGNRFHNALRAVDDFLPKNSDLYEFEKIIETYYVRNKNG